MVYEIKTGGRSMGKREAFLRQTAKSYDLCLIRTKEIYEESIKLDCCFYVLLECEIKARKENDE